MRNSLIILISLFFLACSWSPKPQQPLEKDNADRSLKSAGLYLASDPARAVEMYEHSRQRYRRMADVEGELWSLFGIAQAAVRMQDAATLDATKDEMRMIVRNVAPQMDHIPLYLDMLILFNAGEYEQIPALTMDNSQWPDTARLRIAALALQAEAFMNKGNRDRQKLVQRLLRSQKKQLHRKGATQALTVAKGHYALAYYYVSRREYANALKHIKNAKELDWLYEDFEALGYDYWLQGQILYKQGKMATAKANLIKAITIFESTDNNAMKTKIEAELSSLDQGEEL